LYAQNYYLIIYARLLYYFMVVFYHFGYEIREKHWFTGSDDAGAE
jgi:hypothetical protein